MNRIVSATLALLLASSAIYAQETTAGQFAERYNLLVSKLGPAGVGVETLLNRWEAAYPEDLDMLQGQFSYLLSKSRRTEVVNKKDTLRFLGKEPVLSLKDSLGNPVNFFEEDFYDDEMFGKAVKYLDKAIIIAPDRLDLRLYRISALMGYEKGSPDMAASSLAALIDYNAMQRPEWVYPGLTADKEFFSAAVQEFCVSFFRYATPASYGAFKSLSEKMLDYEPGNVLFMDNLGSYYLVAAKDSKTALKYYRKVLKKKPDDITAIKNCVVLARSDKNEKLEKKYLPLLIRYSDDESTRNSARVRLDYLSTKKK